MRLRRTNDSSFASLVSQLLPLKQLLNRMYFISFVALAEFEFLYYSLCLRQFLLSLNLFMLRSGRKQLLRDGKAKIQFVQMLKKSPAFHNLTNSNGTNNSYRNNYCDTKCTDVIQIHVYQRALSIRTSTFVTQEQRARVGKKEGVQDVDDFEGKGIFFRGIVRQKARARTC
ncbi:hypothetical protein RIF29_45452 [Crotalaria pallida]|uniref:Uncharacterized protein n=1 Tax=Crotalaria pallida TaxID=3830 RepID=A0AAN9DQB1_CROPI